MRDPSKDVRNKILGRQGEERAVRYLKKAGYKILERNYRTPFGEVDVITEKNGVHCFVEVKTRESERFGEPYEAVDSKKRERYRKMALYYCACAGEELNCRFDVISIKGDSLEFFADAYE